MPVTSGAHHVGLTVQDVETASRYFVEALDFEIVARRPDYPAVFVSDGALMLTLWQADADAAPFDRRHNLGLHHLALGVPSREAFEAAHARLEARSDTTIEHGPAPLGGQGAEHLVFLGPSGLRLELVWAPA